MYYDFARREIEDAEGDIMRRDWQEKLRRDDYRMSAVFDTFDATFLDPPDKAYSISDRFGGKVELSSQEALNLLEWLSARQNDIIMPATQSTSCL